MSKDYVRVADVMAKSVRTIAPTATISEATALMREGRFSSLVVERRDEADEFGMLVVSDIAAQVVAEGRSPDRVNVYEAMSKPVMTLSPDMNIKYACQLLVKFKITRALVVDENRQPIGIVTLRDMVLRHDQE